MELYALAYLFKQASNLPYCELEARKILICIQG